MKNNLIIIGNGFDIWQGLNTRYSEFEKYYYEHRDAIMKKLFIRKHKIKNRDGSEKIVSDVELVYGNPFEPNELDHDFWNTFEESLGDVDDVGINYFFGKNKVGLYKLAKSVKNAKRILIRAFVDWIKTIEINEAAIIYSFDETCTFLNFNYTDTLQKRFEVPYSDIHFIHGEANDKKSIVFGHSSQPEPPFEFAKRLGGRFRGLYDIEKLLYETDKHVDENFALYVLRLSLMGVKPEDIKKVYVLGHSFGKPDFEYFRFLVDITKKTSSWHISYFSDNDKERIDDTMRILEFNNYTLYKTIDDCISEFAVKN